MIDLNNLTNDQKRMIIKMVDTYLKQNGVQNAMNVLQIGGIMEQSIKENMPVEGPKEKAAEKKKAAD